MNVKIKNFNHHSQFNEDEYQSKFFAKVLNNLSKFYDIDINSISSGSHSKLYKINDTNNVIKISLKPSEYHINSQLMIADYNYLVNVYDAGLIYDVNGELIGNYSIMEEVLTAFNNDDLNFILNKFINLIENFFDKNKKNIDETDYYSYQELSILLNEDLSFEFYQLLNEQEHSSLLIDIYNDMVGAINEIKTIKHLFLDFHIGNIGYDINVKRYKLFDMNYLWG